MSWIQKLMPTSQEFFLDFEEQAGTVLRAAELLHALLGSFTAVAPKVRAIRDLEHLGDDITHRGYQRLHRSFVTPFDREPIRQLLSRLDDVLDATDEAAQLLEIYEVTDVPRDACDLSAVLVESAEHVRRGVLGLRDIRSPREILIACREVARCENQADSILRAGLALLLRRGSDPLSVMKWKEILSLVESATDRCEDVANVLESLVLEHG
jgi:uncharacterized protein Yka (UPF0111/DUF47 family)